MPLKVLVVSRDVWNKSSSNTLNDLVANQDKLLF